MTINVTHLCLRIETAIEARDHLRAYEASMSMENPARESVQDVVMDLEAALLSAGVTV